MEKGKRNVESKLFHKSHTFQLYILIELYIFQQFISRLSTVRPNIAVSAVQPIRFYSVQENPETKTENAINNEEQEPDKLYKRLELEIRGHDPMVMRSYVKFATTAAEHLNIDVGKR